MGKRFKKILSAILAIAMSLGAGFAGTGLGEPFATKASAATYGVLTYEIRNGGVTITGCDESVSGELVIPAAIEGKPVTGVGGWAFGGRSELTGVTIPDGVTKIGNDAFYDCASLTSVTIPDGVTSVGVDAFFGTGIYNYAGNWKNGVLYIGNHLIKANCSAEGGVVGNVVSGAYTIKDGTKAIADYAFFNCSGLTSVTIPDGATSVGEYAFSGCSALADVYYGGTKDGWENISIGECNDPLRNANIHFTVPVPPPPQNYKVGDVLHFGSYPQSRVTDADLKAQLRSLSVDPRGDCELNGNRYRCYSGEFYLYEPIKWKVVSVDADGVEILSKKILDQRPYNETPAADVAWENGSLRAWLNGDFYDTAFSADEKPKILNTALDNNRGSEDAFTGPNTEDKVYVPSYYDMDAAHGLGTDADRKTVPTDLASAKGSGAYWWLRTRRDGGGRAYGVGDSGGVDLYYPVDNPYVGVCPALRFNSDVSLRADGGTVYKGSDATVAISISPSSGACGGNFTLKYDSDKLTVKSASVGSALNGYMSNYNLNYQDAGNLIRFTFSGTKPLSASGTVLSIVFTAKEKGIAPLEFTEYRLYDGDALEITASAVNGAITIIVKKGDVNNDDVVDAGDAVLVSRYDAGLTTLTTTQLSAGDVNGDGVVDAGDAVLISRYDAGLISRL